MDKVLGLFKKGMKMPVSAPKIKKDTASLTGKGKGVIPQSDSLHGKQALGKVLPKRDTSGILFDLKKNVKTSGNVSLGYDYGIVPFTTSTTMPLGFYKAEGNSKVEVKSIPADVMFYYSDLQSISGLRNYFRVSFDEKKFKENMQNKAAGQIEQEKSRLGNLYKERQDLEKKLDYMKSMPDPSDYEQGIGKSFDVSGIVKVPPLPKESMTFPKDSLSAPKGAAGNDSIARLKAKEKQEADSIAAFSKEYSRKYDSIQKVITKYQKMVDDIEWKIAYAKKTIHALENPEQLASKEASPYLGKVNSTLMNVKKLDVGLCYPNYSTFLISGATVRGVNLEAEKEGFFLGFTYGKTLSNLLYTNNMVQNSLSNMQNLYNFFDFTRVNDSRRIVAIKMGPGKKDETHLHVGFLYGIGSTSYITEVIPPGFNYEKNYVIEVDGKVVITKNNILDLVYGKSSILQSSSLTGDFQKGLNAIMDPQRSNAALVRFASTLARIKTKVTLTGRYVDPFFTSYGIGFMRSDNFRYELKAEQTLTKKIKLTTLLRKEQDNLLSLYNYTTRLTTIGANISIKLNRTLTLRAGYSPVLQTVDTKDGSYSLNNHNNISNFILTYTPRMKKLMTSFNALYSYYNLSTLTQTNLFQNVNVNNTLQGKGSPLRFTTSANWFYRSGADTAGNNTLMITEDISYTVKKGAVFSVGGKAAHNDLMNWQYGYMVRAHIPVIKHFSIEGSFEKLVIGDFYNSLGLQQIQKFPYYCSGKIIYNW